VRQAIRGYSDGLIALSGGGSAASPGGAAQSSADLASELAAVGAVIAGSEDLSRALGDPGVPVAARRGVLHDLFESRVGATTMRLIDFVLGVDRAPETVDDIQWLAERFDAASQGMEPIGDIVLGTKGAEERIDGYATALLQTVADRPGLATIEDELFRFARVVAGSDELRRALTDRDLPAAVRGRVVTDLLQGKATPLSVLLATYTTQVGRPRDVETLLGSLIDRIAAESNRRLADVRSARPLDDQQIRNLEGALSRAVGHDVEVRIFVDPTVVAGFVATVGDTVVDGSARHQLELLRERLVTPEAMR